MNKTLTLLSISAALALAGAGCVPKAPLPQPEAAGKPVAHAGLTKEQRSTCAIESMSAAQGTAYNPEDKNAPQNMQERFQESCLDAMDQNRTYHLVRFPAGDKSEGAAEELRNSLEHPYHILELCESAGFAWKLQAEKSDRRAYYECRTTCAADQAAGGVACQGTAYVSPRYLDKTTVCRPEQRGVKSCPTIKHPVCATVNVRCAAAPCEPIRQTLRNECEACKNALVSDYASGICPEAAGAAPPKP